MSQPATPQPHDRRPASAAGAAGAHAGGTINLGAMSLAVAPGWKFYPLEDRVAGRPETGVGALQIKRVPLDVVPWPATHEICMSAAIEAAQQPIEGPGFDRAREQTDLSLAGGESFRSGEDYLRIWYRHCPDGLIAAWFAVKQKRSDERTVMATIRECDRMVATVRIPPPVA